MDYQDAERIALEVMAAHGCHTAILYGSWARGQATDESDVDVLCVREEGKALRDARIIDGVYLDAFIYPRAELSTPGPSLLRVLGGVVLREVDGCGTALLAELSALHERGPAPLPEDERRAVVLWSRKMLERMGGPSGLEVGYRRMQLYLQCLEDYFALRGRWFEGPRQAYAWLLQHDTAAYRCFAHAALPAASADAFVALVQVVYGPFSESVAPGAAGVAGTSR
jgi:predicted nucleotidyltransferase